MLTEKQKDRLVNREKYVGDRALHQTDIKVRRRLVAFLKELQDIRFIVDHLPDRQLTRILEPVHLDDLYSFSETIALKLGIVPIQTVPFKPEAIEAVHRVTTSRIEGLTLTTGEGSEDISSATISFVREPTEVEAMIYQLTQHHITSMKRLSMPYIESVDTPLGDLLARPEERYPGFTPRIDSLSPNTKRGEKEGVH